MESWLKVAIMRVEPEASFLIGFISVFSPIPVMSSLICHDQLFGMRPGPEDVTFVVQAKNTNEQLELILVEITDIDNPEYATVAFY